MPRNSTPSETQAKPDIQRSDSAVRALLRQYLRRARLGLAALLAVVMVTPAGVAYGDYGRTWLNWVYTYGGHIQWTGPTSLRQVAGQGNWYWSCANMWKYPEGYYIFQWVYCSPGGRQAATPAFTHYSWRYAEPVVYNDSGYNQYLWGWEWIETCC